jgi:hypothetical protein
MSFLRKLRNSFSGPAHIETGRGAEGAEEMDALAEEFPAAASDDADMERSQAPAELRQGTTTLAGGPAAGVVKPDPGVGAFAEAEAEGEAADDAADEAADKS